MGKRNAWENEENETLLTTPRKTFWKIH